MTRIIISVSILFFLLVYSGCHKDNPVGGTSTPAWTQVNTGFWNPNLNSINIASLFADGPNLFAGTDSGVYVSTNQGAAWTRSSTGIPQGGFIRRFAASGSLLITGGDRGAFSTTNNGTTWTAINNGLQNSTVYTLIFVGSDLLAGTELGVYRSTNNGSNWEISNVGFVNPPEVFAFQLNGTKLLAGGYQRAYVSIDQGHNWTLSDSGFTGNYLVITSFAVIGSNTFVGLYTLGVYRSTDNGISWSVTKNGLTNLGVTTLAASGTRLFAGTDGGVYVSTDNGSNWASIGLTEPTGGVDALAITGAYLFAGTGGVNGGVWRYPLQ